MILWIFFLLLLALSSAICHKPLIRRSWGELTKKEQQSYIKAMTIAYENGMFDKISSIHYNDVNFAFAHFKSGFFSWHRWYIWKMEEYLRSLGPEFECLTLTYWDWEYHDGDYSDAPHVLNPSYFGSITNIPGCVSDGFFKSWYPGGDCVRRTWDRNFTIVGQKELADLIVRHPQHGIDSHGFRSKYEGASHSNVHNWLGGNMGTATSTNDPIFYLHHSNVDRHYTMWQDCHDYDKLSQEELGFDQYAGTDPNYNGIDDILPYGSSIFSELVTPRSLFHVNENKMLNFQYHYSKNRYPAVINQNNKDKPCKWDWIKVAQPVLKATSKRSAQQKERDLKILNEEKPCSGLKVVGIQPSEVAIELESNGHIISDAISFGFNNVLRSETLVGLKFPMKIPQGVRVDSANINFYPLQESTFPVYLKVYIENKLNTPNFGDKPISARLSGDKILWTLSPNSGVPGLPFSTPDLTDLINKLVSLPDWSESSHLGVIIGSAQVNAPHGRLVDGSKEKVLLQVSYCEN